MRGIKNVFKKAFMSSAAAIAIAAPAIAAAHCEIITPHESISRNFNIKTDACHRNFGYNLNSLDACLDAEHRSYDRQMQNHPDPFRPQQVCTTPPPVYGYHRPAPPPPQVVIYSPPPPPPPPVVYQDPTYAIIGAIGAAVGTAIIYDQVRRHNNHHPAHHPAPPHRGGHGRHGGGHHR